MKKTIISILMVVAICLTLTGFQTNDNQPIFASEDSQYVMTIGCGELTTKADTIKFNFGITKLTSTPKDGNDEINEIIDNLKNSLSQLDSEATLNIEYFSSYPISNSGICQYQLNCNFSVTTKNLDKRDDILTTIMQNETTSFYGTTLELTDKQDIYNQALLSAKDDAQQKAQALYGDVKLLAMHELSLYSYEQNGEIKIEAQVKAIFKTQTQEENTSPALDENNQSQNMPSENTITPNHLEAREDIKENLTQKVEDDTQSSSSNNGFFYV